MLLRRLFLATAASALAGALMLPAAADQVFQSVSTGKLPAPTATYNPNNVTIDYLYYPCGYGNGQGNGRFNPFNAQNHSGPISPPPGRNIPRGRRPYPPYCNYGNRFKGRPPMPPNPGRRVIPLATPRS